jgi:hypothetical protein
MVEVRLRGACKALYCLDIARSIDLVRVQESVTWDTAAQAVGRHATALAVELALDHLGALCSTWDLPFEEPVDRLVEPSALLYDHAGLIARSREVVHEVMAAPLADSPRALARILCVEEQELPSQAVADALAHSVSYGPHDACLADRLAAFRMGGDTEACTRAWRTCRRTAARSSASVDFTPFR